MVQLTFYLLAYLLNYSLFIFQRLDDFVEIYGA